MSENCNVDIGLERAQLLLGRHAKLLLLVDDEESQVFPLHVLAQHLLCTDEDIDASLLELGEDLTRLFGRPRAREILHLHGQVRQALAEGLVMLEGEHGGGHEHRHLLAVGGGLEGGTHRHLGLAEAHVAAHQAVHGAAALHIGLHVVGGLQLVGGVLIEETALQLMLQIGVGTEREPFHMPTLGIEFDEVAGDVLDALLRALLHALPSAGAERAQAWRLTAVGPAVFGYLVERVYRHVDHVATLVDDAYHLLVTVLGGHAHQTTELADAEVDMHHVVARLHLLQLLHREGHLAGTGGIGAEAVLMETVENLVVGEAAHTAHVVGEALVEGLVDVGEGDGRARRFLIVENVAQALYLLGAVGEHEDLVTLQDIVLERLTEQGEVLVEDGLRCGVERDAGLGGVGEMGRELHPDKPVGIVHKLALAHQLVLLAHLAHDLVALLLGGSLHALGQGLGRESLVVDTPYGLRHIVEVVGHEEGVGGQETEKRHLLAIHEFGHDLHALLHVFRELGLYVEGADGVDLIAEEVDAERILAAERVDIDDAASLAELAGLVDVVVHLEAEVAQPTGEFAHVEGLAHLHRDGALVEPALGDDQLAQCLRTAHHVGRLSCLPRALAHRRETGEHLGAQDLIGGLALSVFHRALVGGGEEECPLLPHHLLKVVIEIASALGILEDEEHSGVPAGGEGGKEHGGGRPYQSVELDGAFFRASQEFGQGGTLCGGTVVFL